jgi:O-antigen ligase
MKSFSMSRSTRFALRLFIFSVPWGIVDSVLGVASITRLFGVVAIGLGIATALLQGRIRKPGVIFWASIVFVMSTGLSLVWTIASGATLQGISTYLQLLAVIWLMGEFVRTRDELDSMMRAFWLGSFVLAFELLWNFSVTSGSGVRFSATGFNPNYVGFTLAMGFPMAWRQFSASRGALRAMAGTFCILAPLVLLLTASRSAALAGVIAVAIIPLTLRRPSRALVPIAVVALIATAGVGLLVPQATWERLTTTTTEIEQGTLGGRGDIWAAGWLAFQDRPLLGSGTATFQIATRPMLSRDLPGHNTPLSLLVEQGVVGLSLFAGLLAACLWAIAHLRSEDRKMWAVLMFGWSIMAMAHDSHGDKVTWVLFGLLAAQHGISRGRPTVEKYSLATDVGASRSALVRRPVSAA